jgi:protein Mpv17
MIRTWFLTLEKLFGQVVTVRRTVGKVVLDQLAFAPFSQMTVLTTIGALQGQNLTKIKTKIINELPSITFTGWKVIVHHHKLPPQTFHAKTLLFQIWPFVNLVNFYFVPFLLRPLLVSFVAIFWYTFLAYKANQSQSPHEDMKL